MLCGLSRLSRYHLIFRWIDYQLLDVLNRFEKVKGRWKERQKKSQNNFWLKWNCEKIKFMVELWINSSYYDGQGCLLCLGWFAEIWKDKFRLRICTRLSNCCRRFYIFIIDAFASENLNDRADRNFHLSISNLSYCENLASLNWVSVINFDLDDP